MKFSLFRKHKQAAEPENPAVSPQEEIKAETASAATPEPQKQEALATAQEQGQTQEVLTPAPTQKAEVTEPLSKTYLKAMPLKELADIEKVKVEVKNGNIVILRVTPLANKSLDDVKNAVNDLYKFSEEVAGDIARLGEERVVICPKNIRIWREKAPPQSDSVPTAA